MDETPDPATRYGYFVLQSRLRIRLGRVELDGVVENLSTGERKDFRSIEDMAGVIGAWASAPQPGALE